MRSHDGDNKLYDEKDDLLNYVLTALFHEMGGDGAFHSISDNNILESALLPKSSGIYIEPGYSISYTEGEAFEAKFLIFLEKGIYDLSIDRCYYSISDILRESKRILSDRIDHENKHPDLYKNRGGIRSMSCKDSAKIAIDFILRKY